MKKYLCILLFVVAGCNSNKGDERPEVVNNPELRKETGGTPDETTVEASGIFYSSKKGCRQGFGLCTLQLGQSNNNSDNSVKENQTAKSQAATLYMSTSKDSVLRIEFNQEMPQFEEDFYVSYNDTLRDVLGHEFVVLKQGNYKSLKGGRSKYGSVEIAVVKGPEKSSYPQQ